MTNDEWIEQTYREPRRPLWQRIVLALLWPLGLLWGAGLGALVWLAIWMIVR